MEFYFDIKEILPGRITVVESKDSNSILKVYDLHSCPENVDKNWICNLSSNISWDVKLRQKKEHLENVINNMGLASAQAQSLLSPITTFDKLLNSSQQKIYIIRDIYKQHCVIGILKVGVKRLFICDDIGAHHEIDAMCVLDFYVHESKQRCGFGHELFDFMLMVEKIDPLKLAIDRPSLKFLAFLQKHYDLKEPKHQANNFIVYSGFFNDRSDMQMSNPSTPKQNCCNECSNMSSSLNTLEKLPVLSKHMRSKAFYSSNCHHKDDSNATIDSYYRKKRAPNFSTYNDGHSSNFNKTRRNSSVYDAMHSYFVEDDNVNDCNKSLSTKCSLTPIDNANGLSQKNYTQLQSSWNILGVKPMDYSMIQKKT